jgi:hypothetical protein
MPKSTSLTIEFGERVISNSESVRIYFFLTSPTGQTSNIVDSDRVRKSQFVKLVDNEGIGGRLFRIKYDVYKPIVITMICITTRLGERTRNEKVVFEVGDEESPVLEITGTYGFGKLIGHVNLDSNAKFPTGCTAQILEGCKNEKKEGNLGLIW